MTNNTKIVVLSFSGTFRGGHEILLRAKLALSDGVAMQLTVRSTSAEVAELVSSAIGWWLTDTMDVIEYEYCGYYVKLKLL